MSLRETKQHPITLRLLRRKEQEHSSVFMNWKKSVQSSETPHWRAAQVFTARGWHFLDRVATWVKLTEKYASDG